MVFNRLKFDPDSMEKLDDLIQKSFTEFVRKERRNLLAASSISLVACVGKISSSEYAAFGLKFDSLTPFVVYIILTSVCLYSWFSFLVYAMPEFRKSRKNWKSSYIENFSIESSSPQIGMFMEKYFTKSWYWAWLTFEYFFPLLLGLISIVFCIIRVVGAV